MHERGSANRHMTIIFKLWLASIRFFISWYSLFPGEGKHLNFRFYLFNSKFEYRKFGSRGAGGWGVYGCAWASYIHWSDSQVDSSLFFKWLLVIICHRIIIPMSAQNYVLPSNIYFFCLWWAFFPHAYVVCVIG